jgi:hypothetical protein
MFSLIIVLFNSPTKKKNKFEVLEIKLKEKTK